MNRTLVSHECPVSILEESLVFNDYQYCLVHLLEEQEKYREWFTERYRALRPNGQILLDNSIFELGESFDSEKYVEWARIIKPNFYIVPDVLSIKLPGSSNVRVTFDSITPPLFSATHR